MVHPDLVAFIDNHSSPTAFIYNYLGPAAAFPDNCPGHVAFPDTILLPYLCSSAYIIEKIICNKLAGNNNS